MQQAHTPTRSLPLAGATNFRDLGGYVGHGGQAVKWRRLFRSDHLAGLTSEDQALLADLGVARAVDFRGQAESAAYAYALPGVAYHPLHIEPTVVQRALELQRTGRQLTAQDAVDLMQDTYRGFVHDNAPRFAELFRLLLASDTPTVFHCTAGKDRTGFAAALILLALGVRRDVVMHDYLLTNALYQRPPAWAATHPKKCCACCGACRRSFWTPRCIWWTTTLAGCRRIWSTCWVLTLPRRRNWQGATCRRPEPPMAPAGGACPAYTGLCCGRAVTARCWRTRQNSQPTIDRLSRFHAMPFKNAAR